MKTLVLLAMAATLGITTTVRDSAVSFATVIHTCQGTLGGVSYHHGHAQIIGVSGVNVAMFAANSSGYQSMTFKQQRGPKSALVTVSSHGDSVDAQHSVLRDGGRVICILPDKAR